MKPYWSDADVTLFLGDCVEVLAAMEPESVDAICTDPPYALGFMGKAWDSPGKSFVERKPEKRNTFDHVGGNHNPVDSADAARTRRVEAQRYGKWCEQWAAECLRVLKPGGHLLAFGGTRTYHRLACAIEDAGFEIRDSIHWIYGSGFPKSLDVSKAIDKAAGADREVAAVGSPVRRMIPGADQNRTGSWIKDNGREFVPTMTLAATNAAQQWSGWGTALKPAHEPIVVARKPLAGTVAQNVLTHGTGALNIDGCRVDCADKTKFPAGYSKATGDAYAQDAYSKSWTAAEDLNPGSRWPPNILLGPEAAAELDAQSGALTSGANPTRRGSDKFRDAYGEFAGQREAVAHRGADSGGASRFFPVFKYEAKANSAERPRGDDGTSHPTVKPIDLMAWLVRLVTPPGGLVLDCFAGSGTTAEACIVEGFRSVLIEKDPAYCDLIRKRLTKPIQPAMFG